MSKKLISAAFIMLSSTGAVMANYCHSEVEIVNFGSAGQPYSSKEALNPADDNAENLELPFGMTNSIFEAEPRKFGKIATAEDFKDHPALRLLKSGKVSEPIKETSFFSNLKTAVEKVARKVANFFTKLVWVA
ncbi:MAG: hypothetical protein K0M45_11690 [Candidatus Paracaedibacteraceae bacterium]|nr:hypothetical protein [Candidatus Paracaedibacteraceae bacterium]